MSLDDSQRKRKLQDDSTTTTSTTTTTNDATAATASTACTPPSTVSSSASNAPIDEELLRLYYAQLFPLEPFVAFLTPSASSPLLRRELSFTLTGDIYIRYLSMNTMQELANALNKKTPIKIDVGAVCNASPALHTAIPNFLAVSKELVFDIDLTDYDNLRTCCRDGSICHRCWPFMIAAVQVLDTALSEDFGFQHILWIYSGRRGVHCWVCDERARVLPNEARAAIVDYLSLAIAGEQGGDRKTGVTYPLHPMLERAVVQITPTFERMIEFQRWLEDEASRERFLSFLDENCRDQLAFTAVGDGTHKWRQFTNDLHKMINRAATGRVPIKSLNALKSAEARIILNHVFPRLDANVSKTVNHLLKAPFCIHPKTGRVCVPFLASQVETFDPFAVPTLKQLEQELNAPIIDPELQPYERTSLKPYVEMLRDFAKKLRNPMKQENKILAKTETLGMESLDW